MSVMDNIMQQAMAQDGADEVIIYLSKQEIRELNKISISELKRVPVNQKSKVIIINIDNDSRYGAIPYA